MAKQTINTGALANDGTGDTLRTAGTKINDNFTELYTLLGGDSAFGGGITRLHDSGLDMVGSTFRTKIGHVDPASEISIDFPDSAGIVIVNTATQTLSNKTLTSAILNSPVLATPQIQDTSSDHQYVFAVSELAADRTVTLPLLTGDDTLVMEAHTQTLTNKTLTTPQIKRQNVEQWISDSTGNPVINFVDSAEAPSVRNRIRVQGAASASSPTISLLGQSDANMNLVINAKGTGSIKLSQYAVDDESRTNGQTTSGDKGFVLITGGAGTIQLAPGTTKGQVIHIVRQAGAGVVNMTIANFNQGAGTGVQFDQYDTATLIWDGTDWYVIGGEGYTIY